MLRSFNLLVMAFAAVFVSAAVFLVYLYKAGQPHGFVLSISLAAGFALLPPLVAVLVARRVPALRERADAMLGIFIGTALLAAIGLGATIL